ncbi:MAG: ThuA domain-containing protein, partial [Verrucomicrobiae bacterium]|nr:ThuA domain-containing protein [Verrucomicrobiae bacterium]
FRNWIGGYFEANWSVNPHWDAHYTSLPNHPITSGVEPFHINDEWYFHMRFREGMEGVTPILSALPPEDTMRRPDGPHSGNPAVRKAVANGEIQHMAWAAERAGGGRGFGFTGGHFHWNWGDENFRKVVLNAIVWTAHGQVPAQGVTTHKPSQTELEANQDEPKPGNANNQRRERRNRAQVLVQTEKQAEDANVSRDADQALTGLEVGEGLQASLFAAEPQLLSPSNIDIDHRGRIWVCEIVNYRKHNGKRPEGDRILILEDSDGDGKVDKEKVFYQGRDIDSPHGVCVLGNKVIVSAGDKVQVFTDSDGDDKPDSQEVLFSGISGSQHDHGIHAFTFGPDGKLYFNFGNEGRQIKDKYGNLITDLAGNQVVANRNPYQEGLVFRCNLDGSEFETLGWNFRNNWLVTVDSYGSIWQSDNDDDGNYGVRLNYILEYGNYGYREENTGAFWKDPRISQHPEIPYRHWHQNDPGVVPNFVHTGAGSPTGITVYEGDLLPPIFRNQVIHCDAGPGVVWAAIAEEDGAGFKGHMVNLLKEKKRGWVRPVDAATAPDGALFVTDWYDPVVSWNRQWDVPRGRIYRLAPTNHRYRIDPVDVSSPAKAAEALKSPNSDARYRARKALLEFDRRQSVSALRNLYQESNSRFQARALWLLAELENDEKPTLQAAVKSRIPDIRVTAIRAARQNHPRLLDYLRSFIRDPSARVRSEVAIALHNLPDRDVPGIWAQLANQLDPSDRWNLEALGIAADGRWDDCLEKWLDSGADTLSLSGRKIVWRSRAGITPELLDKCLSLTSLDMNEVRKLIRAFDFQKDSDKKQKALQDLAYRRWKDKTEAAWLISSEAFQRLHPSSATSTPELKKQLNAFLASAPVNEAFVKLVSTYQQEDHYPAVLDAVTQSSSTSLRVIALQALLDARQQSLIIGKLHRSVYEEQTDLMQVITDSRDDRAIPILREVLLSDTYSIEFRNKAIRALGITHAGAVEMVNLAKDGRFPESFKQEAGAAITQTLHVRAYEEAEKYFPLPQMKGNENIPGMTDLVVLQGNPEHGKSVFREATCITCHQANGEGIAFGPDLSTIGTKLAKIGLYEAILNPNASVSESYQTTTLELKNGTILTGLLSSETSENVSLNLPGGVSRSFAKSEVAIMETTELSLMPTGLQRLMTVNDLADLVEYLT